MANESKPEVAVVMGSSSDWETMKRACDILDQFGVVYHKQVISAHRTPELPGEKPERTGTGHGQPVSEPSYLEYGHQGDH